MAPVNVTGKIPYLDYAKPITCLVVLIKFESKYKSSPFDLYQNNTHR